MIIFSFLSGLKVSTGIKLTFITLFFGNNWFWLFCIGWVTWTQCFLLWEPIWFHLKVRFYKISVLLWWEIKKSWKKNHVKIFHCAKDPTYTYKILTVQLKKTIRAIKLPLKTESVTAMLYVAAGWASCYSWPVSASV